MAGRVGSSGRLILNFDMGDNHGILESANGEGGRRRATTDESAKDKAAAVAAQGEAQACSADLCENKRRGEDSDDSEGECNYRTNASSIDPCNELARDEGRRQT